MARLIEPPLDHLEHLTTPLTDGEKQVIQLFRHKLPEEWEIYVQPYLNGLRPDWVLLHPGVGVAVFEIKDWNLVAMHYYAKREGEGYVLMAKDQLGRRFSLERENPINKILLYKQELFDFTNVNGVSQNQRAGWQRQERRGGCSGVGACLSGQTSACRQLQHHTAQLLA